MLDNVEGLSFPHFNDVARIANEVFDFDQTVCATIVFNVLHVLSLLFDIFAVNTAALDDSSEPAFVSLAPVVLVIDACQVWIHTLAISENLIVPRVDV